MNSLRKAFVLFTLVFAFISAAYSQANFNFEKTDHNFGDVPGGNDTIWVEFKFTNNGSEALEISQVNTSCDCTLAEWPKNPVQPGKSAIIKGGYKIADKEGRFEKSIIIFANTIPAMTMLNITGNVLKK
jgi:hypothetical protein